jgi:hypothetical protein
MGKIQTGPRIRPPNLELVSSSKYVTRCSYNKYAGIGQLGPYYDNFPTLVLSLILVKHLPLPDN